MNKILSGVLLAVAPLLSGAAFAAERTVTLAVENLSQSCPSCAFIVKQTLARVPGVTDVVVSSEDETAVVTFDDSEATVAALTEATGDMGYPSTLVEKGG